MAVNPLRNDCKMFPFSASANVTIKKRVRKMTAIDLEKHGFLWQKGFFGFVGQDEYFDSEPDYYWLMASDGAEVTSEQARAIIDGQYTLEQLRKRQAAVEAAEKEAHQQKEDAKRSVKEQVKQDRETFERESLSGLVQVWHQSVPKHNKTGKGIHFADGFMSTGVSYTPVDIGGNSGYMCEFGNALTFFVTPETAEALYQQRWQKDSTENRNAYEEVLNLWNEYGESYDSDYWKWVVENIGGVDTSKKKSESTTLSDFWG